MESPTDFDTVNDVSLLDATPFPFFSVTTGIPEREEGASHLFILYQNKTTLVIPRDSDATEGFQFDGYISSEDCRRWYREYLGYVGVEDSDGERDDYVDEEESDLDD